MSKSTILKIVIALIGALAVIIAALINNSSKRQPTPPPSDIGLQITSPANNANIVAPCAVNGTTTHAGMKHYILVRSRMVNTSYLEDGPLQVSPTGEWAGIVRLGNSAVGIGDEYDICVMATNAILTSEEYSTPPNDARFSRSITVKRTK